MSFTLLFKPLAEAEVAEAFAWYSQPDIGMGAEFSDFPGDSEPRLRDYLASASS